MTVIDDTDVVTAAIVTKTNADLIRRIAPLHIPAGAAVLDCTYGSGKWWTKYRPDNLTTHDLAIDGVDFRHLPEPDCTFDVVAFDPPYIPQGGRTTSTVQGFMNRYGLVDAPKNSVDLRALIAAGLSEVYRVLRPGGIALAKCMNYVNGRQHRPQVLWSLTDALEIGFRIETQYVHVSGTGPLPTAKADGSPRRVTSPRANYSMLLVLARPASAPASPPLTF